uniref:NAD(+) kinase n=1 Tax=Onchocerca volvulus TaxID=6282 RepID=A0A8R1TTZ7_ONCVO
MVAGETTINNIVLQYEEGCNNLCIKNNSRTYSGLIFLPKHVVILSKTTRLDYERQKHLHLNSTQFYALLKRRGWNYEEMKKKRIEQQNYVRAMRQYLENRGIKVEVVTRSEYTVEVIAHADAVFSAGGDGTFLVAAQKIRDYRAVIGFNTDPLGSEGYLCITRKGTQPVGEVIDKLLKGECRWMWRQRIRVTILKWVENNKNNEESDEECYETSDKLREARLFLQSDCDAEYPLLALNDVFIGESHASRVSYYDVQIDDGPMVRQKSSGMIACTGTGSTSWNYNINRVSEQHVGELLSIMADMNLHTINPKDAITQEICKRFNEKLLFDPQCTTIAFTIRDPVFSATFPVGIKHGFAKRIRVRSRCTNAHIVLDGNVSIPFNSGTEVLLEIHESDALRSALFS